MSDALEKRIKKHIIGKPHRFLAVSPLGFEQTLAEELFCILNENRDVTNKDIEQAEMSEQKNMPCVVGDGKVEFTTKLTEAWKVVATSRIANRVLMEVTNFKAENFRDLEKKASEIPWELYLDVRRETRDERYNDNVVTLSETKGPVKSCNALNIHVTSKHSRLYHSDAIAERLYKIIEGVKAPSQNKNRIIQQNLYVNFLDDRCTIWLDLAGEELYKRGFERFVNDAPLKETIASAMIFESFHILPSTSYCLLDLMSGSGTFSLEAACIANKIIPGICRDFALKHQPAFKEATWNFIIRRETTDERRENSTSAHVTRSETKGPVKSCNETKHPIITKILTSDISERAVNIIKHNIECSPLAQIDSNEDSPTIIPQLRDFFSYTAKEIANACGDSSPILVLNPPYGKRLDFDAPKLFTQIGKKLTELTRDLHNLNKSLTVAILIPKDDTRDNSKYTCTTNLLRECPALAQKQSPDVKIIETSHGGFRLNAIIAKLG
jgi:putative N6-adenine-specific DNA methylase